MIDFLTACIVVAALAQRDKERLHVALIFAVFTQAHGVLLGDMPGPWYFISAAMVDLAIISALYLYRGSTPLILDLQLISIASIVANAAGWVIWRPYLPPTAYTLAYIMLYTYAIAVLVMKGREHVGGHSMGCRWPNLPFHSDPGGTHPP